MCKCDHEASYRVNSDGQRVWCCEDHLQEEITRRTAFQVFPDYNMNQQGRER